MRILSSVSFQSILTLAFTKVAPPSVSASLLGVAFSVALSSILLAQFLNESVTIIWQFIIVSVTGLTGCAALINLEKSTRHFDAHKRQNNDNNREIQGVMSLNSQRSINNNNNELE